MPKNNTTAVTNLIRKVASTASAWRSRWHFRKGFRAEAGMSMFAKSNRRTGSDGHSVYSTIERVISPQSPSTTGAIAHPAGKFPCGTIRSHFAKLGLARRAEKNTPRYEVFLLFAEVRPA